MLIDLLLLVLGFVLMVRGADYFVDGASGLATRLCIPPIIIGLTIVAMGTSAPEAAVSITSAAHGSNAIAIGNVIGSNIANILLILGLSAIIAPLVVQKNTGRFEIPFTAAITGLLFFMGAHYGFISHAGAWLLLGLFVLFLGYLYVLSRRNTADACEIKQISYTRITLYVIFGMLALVFGSNIAVDAATSIAEYIGISERVIGLTIIAIGTSLPELVTSIIAARKGESDLAIGNIVGSNIFNILFVLGLSGIILPIPFNPAFVFDCWIAILAVVMLMLATCRTGRMGRVWGIIFFVTYLGYLICLIK
ncbi:MAG: calcium/sodium antiporter [Alphaproteobacteria bacterium]